MDASELLEKITQLIQQAEQGDIDPWDVKVIEVIDHFLELMAPEVTTRGYESDLSQSGQAFLSASMLVLFKANTLMQMQAAEDEQEAFLDELLPDLEEGLLHHTKRLPLEQAIRRRSSAMPPPKRRVTLHELIEQLQVMADQLKKVQRKEVKPLRDRTPANSVRSMRQALDLAHQENLTEVAAELEQLLYRSASELLLEEEWINLEELVELWQQQKQPIAALSTHQQSANSSLVGVFWALLLLSAQSKVEIHQEDFYGELKIRLLTT
jgi:segregation and condensation protein A